MTDLKKRTNVNEALVFRTTYSNYDQNLEFLNYLVFIYFNFVIIAIKSLIAQKSLKCLSIWAKNGSVLNTLSTVIWFECVIGSHVKVKITYLIIFVLEIVIAFI